MGVQMKIKKCETCNALCNKWARFCKKCYKLFLLEHNRKIIKMRWKNHNAFHYTNGYKVIKVFNHPFANNRGYIYEHRLMMEKKLGRYLQPIEIVHHIDNNKLNNKIENLKLFSSTNEHTQFHGLRGELR